MQVAPDLFHVTSDPSALPITIQRDESRSFVFFIEPTMVPRAASGPDTQPDKDAKKCVGRSAKLMSFGWERVSCA
jgi:hypothetical protein